MTNFEIQTMINVLSAASMDPTIALADMGFTVKQKLACSRAVKNW
jgi:hypothetical protein